MHTIGSTEHIKLTTGAAVATHWSIGWAESNGSSTFNRGGGSDTVLTATDTNISGSPASGLQRFIGSISVSNQGASEQEVTLTRYNGTADIVLIGPLSLAPGESLHYANESGWKCLDDQGRVKTAVPWSTKINGWSSDFHKNGGGSTEASGVAYLYYRDAGFPGAMAVGTPGMAGRALTYSGESGAGFLDWRDPASGNKNYLVSFVGAASGTGSLWLVDALWIQTGIVVTTTTAQTVDSVAFPARDKDESADGRGVIVALLVTGATGNGAAVTTISMSYTNSDGTSGRTATIANFNATCAQGSIIFFQLQDGDLGVQSIQSITLGTSLVSGSVSLVALRRLTMTGAASAWIANPELSPAERGAGIALSDDSCLMVMLRPSSATTFNIDGCITIEERG